MTRMILAIGLMIALSGPVMAQDAGQIAGVQSGQACVDCNLFQADLSYRNLPGIDVSRSRLRQANLSLATMNNATFDGADLSVANLFGARFTGASFANTNLRDAILVGSHFGGANLSGAEMSGANLSGAEMQSATGLTQNQLDTACGDRSTQLPSGLHIGSCR
ncbi:MAG: pentapeptide repeat-containing protein [Maricaulis sp.]|jgi:uncharacterized protein YjbI with pentapeptide repeats|nr:pentapeptide repeat-containing protein [Maricaulis sp.]MDG2044705.1 pentapeptide repeat-containing protein [Maricaulis sp.]